MSSNEEIKQKITTFRKEVPHQILNRYIVLAKRSCDEVQYNDLVKVREHLIHVENQALKYYRKSFGQALTIEHQGQMLEKYNVRNLGTNKPQRRGRHK